MTPPCKDCPDRYIACHDHCEKYKTWKTNLAEEKRSAQLERDIYWTKGRQRSRASAKKADFKIGGSQ